MNILHVLPTLDPATGGPPRIALSLAAGAAAGGNRVTVVYYEDPEAHDRVRNQLSEIPSANFIHLMPVAPPDLLERLTARRARKEIARIIGEIDIIHVHSVWDAISMATMSLAFKRSVPYVLLVNGMLDPWSLSQRKAKKKLAMALRVRRLLNHASFLQAGNSGEKDCIARLRLQSPVRIIPNGIDPEQLKTLPDYGTFHTAHPELDGQPYILFLSRLHYKKGLDYLAAAFAILTSKHPDLRLVVAGPDDGARADFLNDIRARGLESRVHLPGPLFGSEKFSAFRDAACFCLPSRQEGFSVAVLEAMACATPVVISTACHFPEVEEKGAGFVVELQPEGIASAIERIISDSSAQKKMGEVGREMVFQRFTWPQISQQLVEAYREAIRAYILSR